MHTALSGTGRKQTKFAIWWLEASAGTVVERVLREGDEGKRGSPMLTHPCQLAESPAIPSAKTALSPFKSRLNSVTAILAALTLVLQKAAQIHPPPTDPHFHNC